MGLIRRGRGRRRTRVDDPPPGWRVNTGKRRARTPVSFVAVAPRSFRTFGFRRSVIAESVDVSHSWACETMATRAADDIALGGRVFHDHAT